MAHSKLKAGVFTGPQIHKLMRYTFFEDSTSQHEKKSMAELQKRCGILPGKQEVRLQGYCVKSVGELKKPGLQHEIEAALLAFTLRLLSTESL
jgi:hypothetical protein